jgi:hypothetical protein
MWAAAAMALLDAAKRTATLAHDIRVERTFGTNLAAFCISNCLKSGMELL